MPARDHFRAHERRRVDFPATLRIHDRAPPPERSLQGPAGARQDVRVRDLGLLGAGIEIPEPPMDRSRRGEGADAAMLDREVAVTIELLAPTLWDPLVLQGKIAWIKRGGQGRPARAGVRFEHREPAALYGLFQFLGTHAQGI